MTHIAIIIVCIVIVFSITCFLYFKYRCENRVYKIVMDFAPNARKVLDLGCGKCCTTVKLKNHGMNIVSLDVVDKGVCTHPTLFDGKHIPFGNKEFDLGICSFVLHHTQNQNELLKELQRTCKRVILIEDTPITQKDKHLAKKHSESEWGSCVSCFKSRDQWMQTFSSLGLTVLKEKAISRWLCPFSYQPFWYPIASHAFLLQ